LRERTAAIRAFIIENVSGHPADISRLVADRFQISRQAASLYLRRLVAGGVVKQSGKTRAKKYVLRERLAAHFRVPLSSGLAEDRLWREHVAASVADLPPNVADICHHGFTEIVNNAIEHSEGSEIEAWVKRTALWIQITISDDGVGIFEKVRNALGLADARDAFLELSKGKLTTDPEHHTGEGIFFTSRMFDLFYIWSGTLCFNHNEPGDNWLVETEKAFEKGTLVRMQIPQSAERTTREVFDKYAPSGGGYGFTKTHVPVSLMRYGTENLVSRSQAKRLLTRLERFGEVLLDFEGVPMIGQAFADEIFRVYRGEHPEVKILFARASEEVEKMIRRAQETGKS
jgi:anti-sigma regulatory factor (Ser/Thr protein kinase)